MDWLKNALAMAGGYTIARSFLDRDAQKRALQQQALDDAQAAWEVGQQMEALVSDIDDVIADELNAALVAPDPGDAIIGWARSAGPRLRRYRERWGTWWGRSAEMNELVERWQAALDAYIEAIDLIDAGDVAGVARLQRAMADYRVFQAWFLQMCIEAGWRPEA
jgi:hypothetical protein